MFHKMKTIPKEYIAARREQNRAAECTPMSSERSPHSRGQGLQQRCKLKAKGYNNLGIILVSTMLFLLLLTLLAINALQTALLETKMSANFKDNIATLHKAEKKLQHKEFLLQQGITPLPPEITLISTDICGINFYRIKVHCDKEILQSTYAVIGDISSCDSKLNIQPGRQSWVSLES
jgi:Tfp pilus assembly protein PilX